MLMSHIHQSLMLLMLLNRQGTTQGQDISRWILGGIPRSATILKDKIDGGIPAYRNHVELAAVSLGTWRSQALTGRYSSQDYAIHRQDSQLAQMLANFNRKLALYWVLRDLPANNTSLGKPHKSSIMSTNSLGFICDCS